MFERFLENTAQLVVQRRLWTFIIATWFIAAAGMTFFAPSLTEVGVMNEASFLPESSGYLEAKEMFRQKFPDQAAAGQGILIFHDPNGLSQADREYAAVLAGWLASSAAPDEVERVVSIFERPEMEAMLVSQDRQAMLMQVDLTTADYEPSTNAAIQAIRDHVAETAPAGLAVHVSGPAAIGKDMLDAAVESVDKTMLVTIVLVVVVLLLIYRSPVASLVPLITITAAFLVSRGVLAYLAQAGIEIPALLDSFTIVLIFGVGTDYALFLISRFREEMGRGNSTTEAVVRTIAKVGPVIVAGAATVIIGTAGMVVGNFKLIKITGPAMGLSIAITLLASLTLTPTLLLLFGRRLFWPHRRRYEQIGEGIINWKKIGHFVTHRPLLTMVVVLVLLLAPFPAWGRMNSTFNILGEIPEEKDSAQGFEVLVSHFAAGDLAPVTVLLTSSRGDLLEPEALGTITDVTTALESVAGVERVRSVLQPTGDPEMSAAFRVDGQIAEISSGLQEMGAALDDPSQLASLIGGQDPTAGLVLLTDYLTELGARFPGVKDDAHYQGAVATLETLGGQMAAMMDQVRLDAQLALMAGQVEEFCRTLADPQAMAQANEGANPSSGLSSLADYMTELGAAFPELQDDTAYTDALSALDELGPALAALQEQTLVTNQLQMLTAGMQSGAQSLAASSDLLTGFDLPGAYLTELGQAYPEVQADPAWQDALGQLQQLELTLTSLQEQTSVHRQLETLAGQLGEIAPLLADPEALASGSAEAAANLAALGDYLAELGQTFPELEAEVAHADALERLGRINDALAQMQAAQAAGTALPAGQMGTMLAALQNDLAGLTGDVETLKGRLANRPEAIFFPTSVPLPPEALAALSDAGQAIDALVADLEALTSLFVEQWPTATLFSQALMSTPEAQAALQQTGETLVRLAGDLRALETRFTGQETLFSPASLAGQEEVAAAIGTVKADLDRLVTELDALAQGFAGQEAYFIPQTMVEGTPELEELLNLFFASDRTATQLAVLLEGDPYSLTATDTIDRLQEQLNKTLNSGDVQAYVGGVPVMMHDVQRTVDEDFAKVRVVVVVGGFLVFAILLRSLVAPIYLMLSVLLSYGTTMGLSTLLFQDLLGYEGVNYITPIIIFVLLVALGADYNIFLMARVREETKKTRNVKEGIRLASTYTGGIITSCGIILAGTFAALTVSSIKMLVQIGAAIAIGVLIDTFIVRTLLVPAVATLLDKWSWWPGRVE